MQTLQQKLQAAAQAKIGELKAENQAFLDKNKTRPGVITTASGLQYEVLKKATENTNKPTIADTVVVHYAGTLIDGTPFDNSYKRGEPLAIAANGVISGWTEVLLLMQVGDKFKVWIPSEIGYGDRGVGAIPGGATLIFEMELMGIKPAATK